MTNFECMDKNELADALAESSRSCNYCYYNYYDLAPCLNNSSINTCIEGIKKWFDEETE